MNVNKNYPGFFPSIPLDYTERQRLQYLIFPKGMFYDRKNDELRTDEVNSIFRQIAYLNKVSGQNETGQNNTRVDLSMSFVNCDAILLEAKGDQ